MRKAQTWKTKLLNKIDKLGVGRRDRYIRSIIDEDTKEALDDCKEYKASGREVDDPIHPPETRRILG